MKTFNESDLITWSNREKAVIGNEYYFGDSIDNLKFKILNAETYKLAGILDNLFIGTFKNHCDNYYPCILPVGAVKEQEKKYRALQTIDELFDFFYPPKDDIYSLIEKAEILLGKKITLKNKINHRITTMVIKELNFNSNGSDVYLNGDALEWIARDNKIQINGEWQPFGVLNENTSDR